jgi:exonuclease SbcD
MTNRKICVILDIHLTETKIDLVTNIFQKNIIPYCKKHDINTILQGGDIFTNRASQKLNVLMAWSNILDMLEQADIKMYAIAGNHDKTDLSDTSSYLDVFKRSDFKVFNGIEDYKLTIRNTDIFLLPFYEDERYKQILENYVLSDAKNNILITHIGVNGALTNSKTKIANSINDFGFSFFDLTIIGHYHDAQKLKDNVFYGGSLYQDNFGEDEEKGFLILDLDNLTFERIKTDFPKYKKIVLTYDQYSKATLDELKQFENQTDKFRFVLKITKEQALSTNLDKLKNFHYDFKVETEEYDVQNNFEVENAIQTTDVVKLFRLYCKQAEIKGKKIIEGLKILKNSN